MDSLVYMAGTAIAIISTPLWLYFRRSRSKKQVREPPKMMFSVHDLPSTPDKKQLYQNMAKAKVRQVDDCEPPPYKKIRPNFSEMFSEDDELKKVEERRVENNGKDGITEKEGQLENLARDCFGEGLAVDTDESCEKKDVRFDQTPLFGTAQKPFELVENEAFRELQMEDRSYQFSPQLKQNKFSGPPAQHIHVRICESSESLEVVEID